MATVVVHGDERDWLLSEVGLKKYLALCRITYLCPAILKSPLPVCPMKSVERGSSGRASAGAPGAGSELRRRSAAAPAPPPPPPAGASARAFTPPAICSDAALGPSITGIIHSNILAMIREGIKILIYAICSVRVLILKFAVN